MLEVVCGVIGDGMGRWLACQRPEEKHLGGYWEFPGGKVEPNEPASEALTRELREELGIDVAVEEALPSVEWSYPDRRIRLRPYLCRIVSGTPRAIEHQEIRWCDAEALAELRWAAADVPVVECLLLRNPC
jgi:8-oxo-dGTP diphosphatase